MAKFKRNLITTALPYANGPVHIGHLAGDIADDALEVALGRQHVVALAAEVFIPLVHAGKFVDGAEVRRAEAGDLPAELRGALRSGSRALQLRRSGGRA